VTGGYSGNCIEPPPATGIDAVIDPLLTLPVPDYGAMGGGYTTSASSSSAFAGSSFAAKGGNGNGNGGGSGGGTVEHYWPGYYSNEVDTPLRWILQGATEHKQRGAMIEFAVTLPVVVMIGVGTADFGRLFMESTVLSNASGAGAVYAYRTTRDVANLAGAEAVVLANVNGLDSVSASVTKVCDCPAAPGNWISCGSTCSGYGSPRIYVRSSAIQSFDTVGVYPGVPSQVEMEMTSWMRVQ